VIPPSPLGGFVRGVASFLHGLNCVPILFIRVALLFFLPFPSTRHRRLLVHSFFRVNTYWFPYPPPSVFFHLILRIKPISPFCHLCGRSGAGYVWSSILGRRFPFHAGRVAGSSSVPFDGRVGSLLLPRSRFRVPPMKGFRLSGFAFRSRTLSRF